jgi:glucose/arabinose dehydrogenase
MTRRKLLLTLGAAVGLLVSSTPLAVAGHRAVRLAPAAIGADPVATGLDWPAAFTFAPDGRIFYGERFTGDIRIFDPSTSQDTLFVHIPHVVGNSSNEQGLLGIALHPEYPTRPFIYAYATRDVGTLRNQIIRIRDNGGTGSQHRIIFSSDTVAGSYHDGGRILFGPDGMLYAVVGEGHDSSNSQDLSNNAGKVVRMTPTGGVPPGNPFPGKIIWTYGLRNSYGFNFDPQTDRLWETENGPTCNDEINLIVKGANYGWGPNETCSTPPPPPQNTNQDGPDPVLPEAFFTPTIAPVGAAFNPNQIRKVTFTADRKDIASITTVYTHTKAPLSLERGPDGALYFSDAGAIYKLIQ